MPNSPCAALTLVTLARARDRRSWRADCADRRPTSPAGYLDGRLAVLRTRSACVALRRPAAQRLPARRMVSEVVTKCWVKSVESPAVA